MPYFQRNLKTLLEATIAERPLVYLNGPRQVGKSTLIQNSALPKTENYITFDEPLTKITVKEDPGKFVKALQGDKITIIDEIQKVPEIFDYLKISIDENRLKGNNKSLYLISGSANLLALPKLSKALVGRVSVLTLLPFSSSEYKQTGRNFIEKLFNESLQYKKYGDYDLTDIMINATYPEIAVDKSINRQKWFDDYLNTLLQRDFYEVSNIRDSEKIVGLLGAMAMRAGSLINDSNIYSELGLDNRTYEKYKNAVINTFLVFEMQAWAKSNNLNKRFTKARKLFFHDINFLLYILRRELREIYDKKEPFMGHIFENFVAAEIMKNASSLVGTYVSHFRTADKKEIDFVIEKPNGDTIGIEVKLEANFSAQDFNNLKILKSLAGDKFKKGILFYTGNELLPFGKDLYAVPICYLWENSL
ncbi:MAG: ATP-binding protein [Endomicrobium sp.]|jgi:predicted AAA+ superfamily ATPase|nr:ATP-binding protein [Endomicrobium sp.]